MICYVFHATLFILTARPISHISLPGHEYTTWLDNRSWLWVSLVCPYQNVHPCTPHLGTYLLQEHMPQSYMTLRVYRRHSVRTSRSFHGWHVPSVYTAWLIVLKKANQYTVILFLCTIRTTDQCLATKEDSWVNRAC